MIWLAAALGTVLLLVAALLRAGTASLMRTPRADAILDAAEGRRGARTAARILDERELILPALGAVHSAVMVAASVSLVWATLDVTDGMTQLASLIALVAGLVLVGDLLPRLAGRRRPRALAYRLAPVLAPAFRIGARFVDAVDDGEDEESENGDDDEEEIELISSVLEFSDTVVREVMVPRPDMVTVASAAGLRELMELVEEHGFSRMPVAGDGIDDIVGLVIVKDLLPVLAAGRAPHTVAEVMRPIDAVPETKRVSDLLREMQASRTHLALVVDEYGGTAGLVTIEDLLEELVGEIVDEYDEDESMIVERDDGTWTVDGRLPVEDLAEMLEVELPDDEWDTVGGLVLGLAGRVPREGEVFEVGDLTASVTRVQGRRVSEVRVRRRMSAGDPA